MPRGVYDRHNGADFQLSSPGPFDDPARNAVFNVMIAKAGGVRRAVHWQDRLAAPYNLAVRHPFLDLRLIQYLLAVPAEILRQNGRPKDLTRLAFKDLLPESVITPRPQPDLVPFYQLGVAKELPQLIHIIENGALAARGMIHPDRLINHMRAWTAAPAEAPADFLTALMVELWLRRKNK